jgi:hypothetical protein
MSLLEWKPPMETAEGAKIAWIGDRDVGSRTYGRIKA